MSKIKVKVGNDIGNSEHDIIINNVLSCQPNVFSRVNSLPTLIDEIEPHSVIKNIDYNLITEIHSDVIPKGIYYSGYYSLKSGRPLHNIEVGAINNKIDSDVIVVNTLSQIAAYATKVFFKNDPALEGIFEVNADMAISLPVNQYNRTNCKKIVDLFTRKHTVKVFLGPIKAHIVINFDFIKVMPESVPVIFALQQKKQGADIFDEFNSLYNIDVDGSYFKDKKILHVSVGEGTTEYPITNDIQFNVEFINGSNNGVGHAIEAAIPGFMNDVNLRTFSRQNYSDILKDPTHKYFEKAVQWMEVPLESEASSILKFIKSEVERANNDVDIICVHGGGSITLKKYLQNKILSLSETTKIKLFYIPNKYAVTLEAEGLYQFAKSDIFEALKSKFANKQQEKFKVVKPS
jgi:plasmid segregation protein ParM